ncbi:MAG: HEAT repeat domain-containing protein [Aggregatilineales bacterium]
MSLYPEFDNLTLEALLVRFNNPPTQDEDPFTFYSELSFLMANKGADGVRFLQTAIDQADTEHLAAILTGLSSVPSSSAAFKARVIAYLNDSRPLVISEAITWLSRQNVKDALDRVLTLQHHVDPYVRARVLDYISQLFPERAYEPLIQALDDPHFIVRESAVDNLDELNAVEAIPHLRSLLADLHPHVRQAVETALEHLTPEIQRPNAISG